MRTIIYGDIHGCLDEFLTLREELNITPEDREILVGDLVDRGPTSNAVVKYARENNLELVLGNHEYKFIRYKKHDDAFKETGKKNPMNFNDDKLNIYQNLSNEDMEYLNAAPYFIKIDNLTILHGGITNDIVLEKASKKELESLLRTRELNAEQKTLALGQTAFGSRFWSEWYDGNQGVVVYGHEVFSKIKIDKYSFGIDTGCVYGGHLTALIIFDTKEPMLNYDIVQVRAKQEYAVKKIK